MSLKVAAEVETVAGVITVYRARNTANGRERYVLPFTAVPFRDRLPEEDFFTYQGAHYRNSIEALGGKRFNNKQYGGGVIFSDFSIAQHVKDTVRNASVIAFTVSARNRAEEARRVARNAVELAAAV